MITPIVAFIKESVMPIIPSILNFLFCSESCSEKLIDEMPAKSPSGGKNHAQVFDQAINLINL